jgi:hypothetical protein
LIKKKSIYQWLNTGIGFAIAQQLPNEDAEVVINGRQEDKTKQSES